LRLLRHAVSPLETLSLTESFLGIASVLPWFGNLAIHDKSLGRLYHANQASAWGSSIKGSMLTGLICACGLACPGVQSWLDGQGNELFWAGNTAFEKVGFEGLRYFRVRHTDLSLFSFFLCIYLSVFLHIHEYFFTFDLMVLLLMVVFFHLVTHS
jgi:hypothetical protein